MFLSLSFVAGMYVLSFFDAVTVLVASLLAILICIVLLIRKVNIKSTLFFLMCVVLFLSGSIRYDFVANIKRHDLYPQVDKIVTFKAEIIEKPLISEETVSFFANVISVTDKSGTKNYSEKVRFSKFIEKPKDVYGFDSLKMGDVIEADGKFTVPKSSMNNGGFDYAEYLKSEGVFFQCNIESEEVDIKDHIIRPILHSWTNFRLKCMSFFDKVFPEEEGAVLKAFITGNSANITDEVSESFSNSGLSHVLAVSGLHVSVFISLVVSLLKLFNVSKRKQMFFSVIAAFFFVFFTGASVSALRAGVLATFALIAKLIYRKADSFTTLSLAAAVLGLVYPLTIYSASFMLSFAATAGILLFYNTISIFFSKAYKNLEKQTVAYKLFRNIFDSFAVGLSAQIFVTPLLVYLFSSFSVMSIISTMLVSPFLAYMLAGGILFIATSFINTTLALPFGGFIYFLAKVLIFISDYFGSFSFSKVIFGVITPFLLLMYALFIALIFFAFKKNKVAYTIVLISFTILSFIGLINKNINYDTAQVSFINVGQGDCALFKAPGDCDVLFDSGGYSESEGTGEYIIAPYLIKNGVTDVEYVIISHMHSDHIIGLIGVLDELKVDNLIIPYGQIDTEDGKEIIQKAKQKNVKLIYFTAGDKLRINDEIEITAIAPDKRQGMFAKDDNDMGIVARIDYGESSFLFTGDISSDIEKYLIRTYPEKLEADVLKVAHHGSKYSTCQEFIDVVKPEYSYIPVGKNIYGHPTPEVISRLEDSGVEVYRADIHRDVTFYFDSSKIKGVVYNNKY